MNPGKDRDDDSPQRWQVIRDLGDSKSTVLARRKGLQNLIIYVGFKDDFQSEIEPITREIMRIGFNVMTIAIDQQDLAGRTVVIEGKDIEHLVRDAYRTGHYRILLWSSGFRTLKALQGFSPSQILQGLVILNPNTIPFTDIEAIGRLLPATPVLFLSNSQAAPTNSIQLIVNAASKRYMPPYGKQHAAPVMIRPDITICTDAAASTANIGMASDGTLSRSMLMNECLWTYLLARRLRQDWYPVNVAFPHGCFFKSPAGMPLDANAYHASGRSDAGFCPLFIRGSDAELYRAASFGDGHCHYSGQRSEILCQN